MSLLGDIVELPQEEIGEIEKSSNKLHLGIFMSGFVDYALREIVLFTADHKEIIASFDMFQPTSKAQPDFQLFSLIDFGNTIKLGEYEAASSAILYELDPEYKEYADANGTK